MKILRRIFDGKALTLSNLLSALRLALIGVIIRLYVFRGNGPAAACVLLFSGMTDILDGSLARRYGQVTDLGKVLDPLADKLTQVSVSLCLLRQYRVFLPLCALLLGKETAVALSSLAVIRRTGQIRSARRHGKAATVLLVLTMTVHFVWTAVPSRLSESLVGVSMAAAGCSGVLYILDNLRILREERI